MNTLELPLSIRDLAAGKIPIFHLICIWISGDMRTICCRSVRTVSQSEGQVAVSRPNLRSRPSRSSIGGFDRRVWQLVESFPIDQDGSSRYRPQNDLQIPIYPGSIPSAGLENRGAVLLGERPPMCDLLHVATPQNDDPPPTSLDLQRQPDVAYRAELRFHVTGLRLTADRTVHTRKEKEIFRYSYTVHTRSKIGIPPSDHDGQYCRRGVTER